MSFDKNLREEQRHRGQILLCRQLWKPIA